MRQITEFSGTLVRQAAQAEAEARKSLPKEPAQSSDGPVAVAAQPAPPAADLSTELTPVESSREELAQAAEAKIADEISKPPGTGVEEQAALDEAVSKATGLEGDRLARLREALRAVKGRAADVRLVRVFAGDATVANGQKVGDHVYVVDLLPKSMKPTFGREREERGGRDKKRRGRGKNGERREGQRRGSGGGRAGGGPPGGGAQGGPDRDYGGPPGGGRGRGG